MSVQSVHAFAEKVALVSDAAGPIGRAVAIQLALNGCYVIAGYGGASDESARALDELQSLGTLAKAVRADISTSAGAERLVNEVHASFGRLDLLVNCLKIYPESSFETAGDEEFASVVDSNFRAAYFLTKHAVPLMTARLKPRIVNLISRDATPNPPLFQATQWAIDGFTRSLARTLPDNFRVNAVASKSAARGPDPLFPMDADLAAKDAARAVLYLLSPEAAAVNGNILEVGT